ncbi:MAG: OmpA family protein [Saprospiraceae bacterium]|nr:OmpA family protein [Saprospiraceae bacterium]
MHLSLRSLPLLLAACLLARLYSQNSARPPLIIATDESWEVSGARVRVHEYPLSAEQVVMPLFGGANQPAIAEHNPLAKIIPGSNPIWRNRTADSEGEAYHFRKTVPLGPDPIRKVTLEVNADDVARVYINQRLVSAENRDGTIKDGYDDWFTFRSVSGFTYNRAYTYDVTDYFFSNVTNTIFVEAVSLAFDGSHAYFSAKLVIEFDPMPPPPVKQTPAARPKPQQVAAAPAKATPLPEKVVFEAGRDPEIDQLTVGSILELGHVFFVANDYRLDTASYRTLDALVAFVKRHPNLKIEVGGHTNLRPNETFAAELSTNRARAVARYLTDNGAPASQITFKGYGKSQPRVKAINIAADKANQRVEIKVLEK